MNLTQIPHVEAKGLSKYFKTYRGNLHAVDNVDVSIEKGKTLGVVGESGCGKSTLGRTILRLLEPTAGEIFINGENISAFEKEQMRQMRNKMQMIFQDPYSSLNPRKNVSQLIVDPLKVFNVTKTLRDKKVSELMDVVGLASYYAQSYPHELDGGRRQRIGVARALALDPEFIVCDEPVSALDVSIQAQILNLLMDLQDDRGLTYMFITHDLSVIRHISDEIIVMYLGVVVERATTVELINNPLHPYTKELIKAVPKPNLKPENRLEVSLQGEISDPIEPPDRCRFVARCNYASEKCFHKSPKLTNLGNSHFVACYLLD